MKRERASATNTLIERMAELGYELRTFHPLLFWYPCVSCGKEFRRELGWAFRWLQSRWIGGEPSKWNHQQLYCCSECDVEAYIENLKPREYPPRKQYQRGIPDDLNHHLLVCACGGKPQTAGRQCEWMFKCDGCGVEGETSTDYAHAIRSWKSLSSSMAILPPIQGMPSTR